MKRFFLLLSLLLLWCAAFSVEGKRARKTRAPTVPKERRVNECAKASKRPFQETFFKYWRTFRQIGVYMRFLKSSCHNLANVELVKIGLSHHKNVIYCLRFTGSGMSYGSKNTRQLPRKRGLLLTGGLHGNEWNGISSVLYTAAMMMENYGKPGHEGLTRALDHTTVHAIPLLNPDGYRHTWFSNGKPEREKRLMLGSHDYVHLIPPQSRFWRPNRRPPEKKKLSIGVDLNRNFGLNGANWGQGVKDVNDKNYQGPSGFSEPETMALAKYAYSRNDINAWVDIHCCISNIKAPFSMFGYNRSKADEYARVGKAMCESIQKETGKHYSYAYRPNKRNEFSSGISSGWGYLEMGWWSSFTLELSTKTCGHPPCVILPAKMIQVSGRHALAAAKISLAVAASTRIPNTRPLLAPGSRNDNIARWKQYLADRGFLGRNILDLSDTVFDDPTAAATARFQEAHGIKPTRVLDAKTLALAERDGFQFEDPSLDLPARLIPGTLEATMVQKYSAGMPVGASSKYDDDDYIETSLTMPDEVSDVDPDFVTNDGVDMDMDDANPKVGSETSEEAPVDIFANEDTEREVDSWENEDENIDDTDVIDFGDAIDLDAYYEIADVAAPAEEEKDPNYNEDVIDFGSLLDDLIAMNQPKKNEDSPAFVSNENEVHVPSLRLSPRKDENARVETRMSDAFASSPEHNSDNELARSGAFVATTLDRFSSDFLASRLKTQFSVFAMVLLGIFMLICSPRSCFQRVRITRNNAFLLVLVGATLFAYSIPI